MTFFGSIFTLSMKQRKINRDATNKLQHILNSSDSEINNVDRLGHGKRMKISSSSVRSLFETTGVDADESSDNDSLAVGYTIVSIVIIYRNSILIFTFYYINLLFIHRKTLGLRK
jgi:hypothetical protein